MFRVIDRWIIDLSYCEPWERMIVLGAVVVYGLTLAFILGVFLVIKVGGLWQ